jgi:hypothetical protein
VLLSASDTNVKYAYLFVTLTEHCAVNPPSTVVTVIVALPDATLLTTPLESTVATLTLLDDQVTLLSVALLGITVADNVYASNLPIVIELSLNVTPVTLTIATQVSLTMTLVSPSNSEYASTIVSAVIAIGVVYA